MVAIVENFTSASLLDRAERMRPADPISDFLWKKHGEKYADTWEARKDAWKGFHSIRFSDSGSRYLQLEGFITVRNAIVHGLGDLTRQQLRNRAATLLHLDRVKVSTVGDTLRLETAAVERCAEVVAAFVEWLDAEIASQAMVATGV